MDINYFFENRLPIHGVDKVVEKGGKVFEKKWMKNLEKLKWVWLIK